VSELIFTQLFKAAKTVGFGKQEIEQSDQEYLISLMRAISTVSDDVWNKLTPIAQEWFNTAIALANEAAKDTKSDPFPLPLSQFCPGFVGKEEAQKIVETKTVPKGLSAEEVFSKPLPKIPSKMPASKPGRKATSGITDYTRRLILTHPDWPVRKVFEYLKLNGFPNAKPDNISVARGDIRRMIEISKELGYWKGPDGVNEFEEQKQEVSAVQ
jgi:hypothetical protein